MAPFISVPSTVAIPYKSLLSPGRPVTYALFRDTIKGTLYVIQQIIDIYRVYRIDAP
jgi:hypothetical protein